MTADSTVVGFDMGRYAVKAAWARHGKIVRLESLRLPQDAPDVRAILSPWIAKMGLGGSACVVGVPGQQCMFQPFLTAPSDPRTPEQVASMEVIRFNEMASEQMSYGFTLVAANPGERRILLGMARPSVITELLSQAKGLGFDVIEAIPVPAALFSADEAGDAGSPPVLHLNIGFSTTDLAIGSRGGLYFARSFSGGGQSYTEELARLRGVSTGQAENLKITGGVSLGELTAAADRWMAELRSCLAVYENLYPGHKMRPGLVILSGGGAQLPGLAEFVGAQLRAEVRLVSGFPGQQDGRNLSAFAVAAGLALAGERGGAAGLSLLPASVRNDLILRRQKAFWIAAGLAAVLTLGIGLGGGYWDSCRKRAHLEIQNRTLTRLNDLGSRIEGFEAEMARAQDLALPVKKLLRGAPLMQKLTSHIAGALSPSDQITMICDAEIYFTPQAVAPQPERIGMRDPRRAPIPREKKPEGKGFDRIVVEGYTRVSDFSTVHALIAKLTNMEYVASADLLRTDLLVADSHPVGVQKDTSARRFVVDIKLRSP